MADHPKNHNEKQQKIDTRLAQGLTDPMDRHGFINAPTFRGSTVLFPDIKTQRSHAQAYSYGTYTPSTDELCDELNDLEGAAGTVLTPNGLSAITLPLLACLSAGDHALIIDSCYGPTRRFCETIGKRLGIEFDYFPPETGAEIIDWLKPNTKVVFTETPGSNCFKMMDVPLVTKTVKAANPNIVVMMDNTWATPLYFRPLDHGVDITIHALTKYPGGHSDLLLGSVSSNATWAEQMKNTHNALGLCVGSDEVQLVLRGLKTMAMRLRHHQKSGIEIAQWLETLPQVARVMHPALPSDEGYDIWKKDFSGAGGLFSIALKTNDDALGCKFVEALELFGIGYSWGGHESLALIPDFSDRVVSKPQDAGVIVRLQIGLEDVDDIKADIAQAFELAGLA